MFGIVISNKIKYNKFIWWLYFGVRCGITENYNGIPCRYMFYNNMKMFIQQVSKTATIATIFTFYLITLSKYFTHCRIFFD